MFSHVVANTEMHIYIHIINPGQGGNQNRKNCSVLYLQEQQDPALTSVGTDPTGRGHFHGPVTNAVVQDPCTEKGPTLGV